jgi:hypothetical protein
MPDFYGFAANEEAPCLRDTRNPFGQARKVAATR